MIRELLSNYKIHAYNMTEALQITAESLADAPHAAHLLSNLARGFNRAFTRGAMEEVLDQFRYELNTAWGDALARCILFSEVYGLRVTEALEDISRSLDDSRRVIEYANRANHESEMMMRYLTPVSYVLTWRNASDRPAHFFGPWKGAACEKDFLDFHDSDKTLFLKDLD